MSNYTFPCGSVNGLTLAQKRECLKFLRAAIKSDVAARKAAKIADKEAKAAARAEKIAAREVKKAERIAKLEAKLAKMKTPNPKKPSKVVVFKGAEAEARLAA